MIEAHLTPTSPGQSRARRSRDIVAVNHPIDAMAGPTVLLRFREQGTELVLRPDVRLPTGSDRDSTGIVIVDHGSRRVESNRRHEAFVAEWRALRGYPIVESAHMELAPPSIATAFDDCVAAGATQW